MSPRLPPSHPHSDSSCRGRSPRSHPVSFPRCHLEGRWPSSLNSAKANDVWLRQRIRYFGCLQKHKRMRGFHSGRHCSESSSRILFDSRAAPSFPLRLSASASLCSFRFFVPHSRALPIIKRNVILVLVMVRSSTTGCGMSCNHKQNK